MRFPAQVISSLDPQAASLSLSREAASYCSSAYRVQNHQGGELLRLRIPEELLDQAEAEHEGCPWATVMDSKFRVFMSSSRSSLGSTQFYPNVT